MSKELDISFGENLFTENHDNFAKKGRLAAAAVIDMLGGYGKVAERFPIDRGDANRALVLLFLKLARAFEKKDPELAEKLHAAAVQVGTAVSEAGSPGAEGGLDSLGDLLEVLRTALRDLDAAQAQLLGEDPTSLISELGKSLSKLRVLFVYASPAGATPLRVAAELRAIRESIAVAGREGQVELDDLPAAQVDDVRRRLLSTQYEIIHFSGHGSTSGIVLESEGGQAVIVPIEALAEYLGRHGALKCLILNACDALRSVPSAIAPVTIGMEAAVDDDSAIEFARGFYDALTRGKSVREAIEEGKSAAVLKSLPAPPLKVLTKS